MSTWDFPDAPLRLGHLLAGAGTGKKGFSISNGTENAHLLMVLGGCVL